MDLAAVMDELAARIDTITGLRTFAFPPDVVHPPAAIVTYPEEYTFDETFARGMDRITVPVVVLVGKVSDRKSRDQIAAYVAGSGARSIKQVVEQPPNTGGFFTPTGVSGVVATPDHASFAVTDLDVTVRVALDDWTPPATQSLMSQSNILSDIGWSLAVNEFGRLVLAWSTDGTTGTHHDQQSDPLGFTGGSAHTLRGKLDVNNGAGSHVVAFDIDGTHTEFVLSGTTAVFNSTQPLRVCNPVLAVTGRVYSANLRAGIDGASVANPDFRPLASDTTSFNDSTGKTWTVSGNGQIVGAPYESFDSARVTGATFDMVRIAEVDHVAATLTVDIAGQGA